MEKGDWRRFRRWPDDQEEDDQQSRVMMMEGLGAEGARRDPGHSHNGGPR